MLVNGYIIDIEGIDKTGKDLIRQYITILSNYKYVVRARGILSNMVYAEKFGRNFDYNLMYRPIVVYLDVDKEDWEIRCKITHEPYTDYKQDKLLFEKYLKVLESKGINILRYNTSKLAPIQIAKSVLSYIEEIEEHNNERTRIK